MSETNAVERLTTAVRLLSEARDLDDIMRLREMAQVAEQYAKAEKLGEEAVQYAQEIRVRAARKAGAVLRDMARRGQRRKEGGDQRSHLVVTDSPVPTLAELGIPKAQAVRWQRMAAVPEAEFENAVGRGRGETAIARLSGQHHPSTSVTPKTKTNGYTLKQSLSGLQSAAVQVQALAEAVDGGLLGDWSRLHDVPEAQELFHTIESSLPVLNARLKRALREWKEQAA